MTSCYLLSGGVEVIVTLKDTTQSAGFLWKSDRPIAETYSWQHTIFTRERHDPSGIRTYSPSKYTAADPCPKPRGHWEWRSVLTKTSILSWDSRIHLKLSETIYLISNTNFSWHVRLRRRETPFPWGSPIKLWNEFLISSRWNMSSRSLTKNKCEISHVLNTVFVIKLSECYNYFIDIVNTEGRQNYYYYYCAI